MGSLQNIKQKIKIWTLAARPKTLPAAIAPVLTGAVIAAWDRSFHLGGALAALSGAVWLQVGANLANDLFDFQRGVDTEKRLGPTRVTQTGLMTSREVRIGMWISFGFAALSGLYLTCLAGWFIVLLGVSAIVVAVIYSGGPFPVGYHGLGDVFVFLFFGPAAVAGTYAVQAGSISILSLGMSVPLGLLIVNILVVNNYRDLEQDRDTGKITLAVRIGREASRWQFAANLVLSYLIPGFLWFKGFVNPGVLLVLVTIPSAGRLLEELKNRRGRSLNKTLAKAGKFLLFYVLMFSLGGTIFIWFGT